MTKTLLTALTTLALLAACGGGGGGGDGAPLQPADPCQDLGYGTAPATLTGAWDYDLAGTASRLYLFENGTFVDRETTGQYPGFWGVDEGGKITVVYSLTRECPPTGTVMTASGVTAASTAISGTIDSSPMPNLTGKSWSIERGP